MAKPDEKGALAEAATALEDELERFEQLAASSLRVPLDSQRNLDKAAHAAQDAGECQMRLGARIGALMEALTAARQRNAATAEKLDVRRREIQARTAEVQALIERFSELGEQAKQVSAALSAGRDTEGAPVVTDLGPILAQMSQVAENAAALTQASREAGFPELSGQVDGLRQQVLAARNKLKLLEERLSKQLPS
jgi:hypothetical protein